MDYSQALAEVENSEINIRVGESFGWNAYFLHPDGSVTFRDDKGRLKGRKNYCHNPADAWPIIAENKISIYAMSETDARGKWGAEAFYPNEAYHFNDNPLRAAMIVYLMMQDANHA